MMKNPDMVCSKCFKEAKILHGSLGGNMVCEDCYVPEEQLPDFSYIPEGKTGGRIKTPEAICGVCGHLIVQPTPVKLWEHVNETQNQRDHIPRQANILELLLIENVNEEKYAGFQHWRYYGKDSVAVHKDHYTQCLIHRKYWLITNGTLKNDRLTLFGGRYYSFSEYVKKYLLYGERANRQKFLEFLTNNRIKKLKNNPKSLTNKTSKEEAKK